MSSNELNLKIGDIVYQTVYNSEKPEDSELLAYEVYAIGKDLFIPRGYKHFKEKEISFDRFDEDFYTRFGDASKDLLSRFPLCSYLEVGDNDIWYVHTVEAFDCGNCRFTELTDVGEECAKNWNEDDRPSDDDEYFWATVARSAIRRHTEND